MFLAQNLPVLEYEILKCCYQAGPPTNINQPKKTELALRFGDGLLLENALRMQ